MDGGSFDRLTRLFAGRVTRRVGLAGALGALAAGIPAAALELEARQRRRQDRPQRAEDRNAEVIDEKRPCGPRPKDNRCRKHKECCTKYCKPPRGKQKTGRCRCIKPGKKCKGAQTCCGGATCQNRKCTPQPTCGATGGACAADADCCAGLICQNGACAPCVETVCASGCQYATVNAAYAAAAAGSTIYVGAGTYPTGIFVTKDMTIAACPGVTGVVLEPDRVAMESGDTYYVIFAEDKVDTTTRRALTLRNLTLRGTPNGYAIGEEALLASYDNGRVSWTLENCTVTKAKYGIYATGGEHVVTDSTFTDFTYAGIYVYYLANYSATDDMSLTITGGSFSDCDSYAVYFYPEGSGAINGTLSVTGATFTNNGAYTLYYLGDSARRSARTATITNSTFNQTGLDKTQPIHLYNGTLLVDGCTLTNNPDTAIYVYDGDATVKDTLIQGNTAEGDGGGIYIEANNAAASLVVSGSTRITGNSAASGSFGGGVYLYQAGAFSCTATGTSTTNVTGNTPDQCYKFVNGSPGTTGPKDCNTWA